MVIAVDDFGFVAHNISTAEPVFPSLSKNDSRDLTRFRVSYVLNCTL
jgi:hypothetical protein